MPYRRACPPSPTPPIQTLSTLSWLESMERHPLYARNTHCLV